MCVCSLMYVFITLIICLLLALRQPAPGNGKGIDARGVRTFGASFTCFVLSRDCTRMMSAEILNPLSSTPLFVSPAALRQARRPAGLPRRPAGEETGGELGGTTSLMLLCLIRPRSFHACFVV